MKARAAAPAPPRPAAPAPSTSSERGRRGRSRGERDHSVVELDRIAGEPLDLLVNNTVVAQGEVVLVNDRYGIRLTRVVPPSERLEKL